MNNNLKSIAKDGKKLKTGERGEVLLGGGSLMKEYANNHQKTAEVFCEIRSLRLKYASA